MNLLDLYEGREPHQQAIDRLEHRRIEDLEARMDDCARRGDVEGFRRAKAERDSYHKVKTNEGSMKDWLWKEAESLSKDRFVANAGEYGMSDQEAAEWWDDINGVELDEKLKGLPSKTLGSARDVGKSVKKFRAQRGLEETGPDRVVSQNVTPQRDLAQDEARSWKRQILKNYAMLGRMRTEAAWALENNVYMNKEQILDYIEQKSHDPALTALEYMHDLGHDVDGLFKNVSRFLTGAGVSPSKIQAIQNKIEKQMGEINEANGIGQDIADKKEKIARATPQTKAGAVASTVKNAAKWLAGKGGPGKEGPTYEDADDAWSKEGEWKKIPKTKSGKPVDPRGEVTHLSDVARREAALKARGLAKTDDAFRAHLAQKKNSKEVDEDSKPRDLAAAVMLKKAHAAFPSAGNDAEALALWIAAKEQRDVDRLERENEQEEEMIARIADQLKKKEINELSPATLKSYADKRGAQVSAMKADNPDPVPGSKEWVKQAIPAQQVSRAKQKIARAERQQGVEEGWQDFNKVEPYAVCLAGRPVKEFDYYEDARRFHDNWKKKLYREGNTEKADKITLMPIMKEDDPDGGATIAIGQPAGAPADLEEHGGGGGGPRQWHAYVRSHRANEAANPAQQAAIAVAMKKAGKKPKQVDEAGTAGLEDTIRQLMAPAYEEETGGWFSYTLEKKAPTMARLRNEYSDDLNDIFYNATPEELHQAAQELKDMYGKVEQGVAEAEDQIDPIILKALERLQPGLEGSQLYSAAKEALALEFGLMKARGDSTFVHYLNWLQDLYNNRQGIAEHGGGVNSMKQYIAWRKSANKERGITKKQPVGKMAPQGRAVPKGTVHGKLDQSRGVIPSSSFHEADDVNFGHTFTGGSWIVYDPETKQIKKRFKTHTAGKSYAKTHGLGFASSEYYFDNVKPAVTAEGMTDYQKRRQRERDVDMGKPVTKQRQSKQTDYQKRRAQQKKELELGEGDTIRLGAVQPGSQGYDAWYKSTHKTAQPGEKTPTTTTAKTAVAGAGKQHLMPRVVDEDQDTSGVESAIIRRIMVAHLDWLQRFGPEKVMQAAEEVAYNVGDVDEIGTSDVSAYVHEVGQILGADQLDEKWSAKYKRSIDCSHPKGFSQKAHCAGRKK